jgi:hypothetical protein
MDAIVHEARVLHLAMWDGREPYLVPLSFGYDGDSVYFHTATSGRKIDVFRSHPEVCFEVEAGVEAKEAGVLACGWSAHYRSVIGYGRVEAVEDAAGKLAALKVIMRKYSGRDDHTYDGQSVARTAIWRVHIDRMTGKRHDRAEGE